MFNINSEYLLRNALASLSLLIRRMLFIYIYRDAKNAIIYVHTCWGNCPQDLRISL